MTSSHREHLITWLSDAHAMEEQAKSLLKTQIDRLESYPEAVPRLQDHLRETEQQAQMIEQCLQQLGSDTSTLKDMSTKFTANMQGIAHMFMSDEVLKHTLASHAFERFEAACYCSLMSAAQVANEPQIARVAEQILRQEEEMGAWIWDQIPHLTEKYMNRSAAGAQAKV